MVIVVCQELNPGDAFPGISSIEIPLLLVSLVNSPTNHHSMIRDLSLVVEAIIPSGKYSSVFNWPLMAVRNDNPFRKQDVTTRLSSILDSQVSFKTAKTSLVPLLSVLVKSSEQ